MECEESYEFGVDIMMRGDHLWMMRNVSTQWNKGKGKTGRRQPYRWPVYLEQNLHDHHDLEEKDETDEHDVLEMVKDASAHVTEKGSEVERREKKKDTRERAAGLTELDTACPTTAAKQTTMPTPSNV